MGNKIYLFLILLIFTVFTAFASPGCEVPNSGTKVSFSRSKEAISQEAFVKKYGADFDEDQITSRNQRVAFKAFDESRDNIPTLIVQNHNLKYMNDVKIGKRTTTAIDNYIIELYYKEFASNFGIADSLMYTDHKMLARTFSNSAKITAEEIETIVSKVNQKAKAYLSENGFSDEDIDYILDSFSMGYGDNFQEANLAARRAREEGGERFKTFVEVKDDIRRDIEDIAKIKKRLFERFKALPHIWPDRTQSGYVSAAALKVIRDYLKEPHGGIEGFIEKFKFNLRINQLSREHAEMLIEYYQKLDGFIPHNLIISRKNISPTSQDLGGILIDFKGFGAQNIEEVSKVINSIPSSDIMFVENTINKIRDAFASKTKDLAYRKYLIEREVRILNKRDDIAEEGASYVEVRENGDEVTIVTDAVTEEFFNKSLMAITQRHRPKTLWVTSYDKGPQDAIQDVLRLIGEVDRMAKIIDPAMKNALDLHTFYNTFIVYHVSLVNGLYKLKAKVFVKDDGEVAQKSRAIIEEEVKKVMGDISFEYP